MLWWKGVLTDERVLGMLAALQGIKPPPPPQTHGALDADAEQPSLDQIMQARLRASLDLDLRESAIDKSLGDLRTIETQIKTESKRLDDWKTIVRRAAGRICRPPPPTRRCCEVQRTLEAIAPKQAKEQIMKMLKEPKTPADDPMEDIVTNPQGDAARQAKEDSGGVQERPRKSKKLAEILAGDSPRRPDTELLRDTRSQLQQPPGSQR